MNNTANTANANAEQVAQQFDVKALSPRLEMMMPYGRDNEQAYPTGCDQDCPLDPNGC